jgi:hypothetical protein
VNVNIYIDVARRALTFRKAEFLDATAKAEEEAEEIASPFL